MLSGNHHKISLAYGENMVAKALSFSDECSISLKLDSRESVVLRIVIEEFVTNFLQHGNVSLHDFIEFSVTLNNQCLALSVIDNGLPFNPSKDLKIPDLKKPVDQRQTGGLGWTMINNYFNIIEYRYENNQNRLLLQRCQSP